MMSNKFAGSIGERKRTLKKIMAELFDREDPEYDRSAKILHPMESETAFKVEVGYQKEQLEVLKVFST